LRERRERLSDLLLAEKKMEANSMNTTGRALPQFICDLLSAPPKSGEDEGGVHRYLFRLARVLHSYRSEAEIIELLRAVTATCGRIVPEREIQEAVRNSRAYAWTPGQQRVVPRPQPWPPVDKELLRSIVTDGIALVDLWEASPIRWEDNRSHAEDVIDLLFPGNPFLCGAWSESKFATLPREDWRGQLPGLQFIVPSPMSGKIGLTQDGRESAHTLSGTGLRRFFVVECDYSEKSRDGSQDTPRASLIREFAARDIMVADMCAAVLGHLARFAPLVLVVHSAGKSLHGWFFCLGQPEDGLRRFFSYAVSLGADPIAWTRSQFVRMPDGLRPATPRAKRQKVFFFDPQLTRK
jgi:hypothetical protein